MHTRTYKNYPALPLNKKYFIVQLIYPKGDNIALSDWKETSKRVEAPTAQDAIKKVNTYARNNLGTWQILDCYEDKF